MDATKLNRQQLTTLKQDYLTDQCARLGRFPSWGELADANNIISDAAIFDAYAGVTFSCDDFSYTAGQ